MVKKVILTDIDGVCVSWNDGFIEFMTKRGYPEIPEKRDSYFITERHECPAHLVGDLITEYCQSETIAKLKPIKDSVEVIKRLHSQGYTFIAITSLGSHQRSFKYRWQNLQNLYGDAFSRLICLPAGSGKIEALEEFVGQSDVWVEDHVTNASDGADLGFNTFLVDQPYNNYNENPHVKRVNGWLDIENWINSQ
jgi:uncharacterized HAD superfamily protein